MRYLIKYSKESDIKFISHLDVMRTIQRIVRRAELPIQYSKGFNPHMAISIAQPLSVGMYSEGEYMDVILTEDLEEDKIKEKMNANAPIGIRIKEVTKIEVEQEVGEKKKPQAMALIDGASYIIKLKYCDTANLASDIRDLMNTSTWNTIKKSKNGEKEVDIKPLIKEFEYCVEGTVLKVKTLLACGSRENLSAQLLAEYIQGATKGTDKEAFIDIKREEMYAYQGEKLVPLYKCVK